MKILSRRNGPARDADSNGDGVVDARDESTLAGRGDGQPVVTDRDAERTTYRSGATATVEERAGDAERRAADRAATARAAVAGARRAEPEQPMERTADLHRSDRPVATDLDHDGRPDRPPATDLDRDGRPDRPTTTDLDHDGRPDTPVATDLDRDGRPDADPRTAPVVAGPKPRASLLATLGLIVSVVGALFVLSGTLAGYGIGLGAVGAVLAVFGLVATRRRHVAGKTDALIGIAVGLAAVVLGVVAMTGQFDWPTTDGAWVGRFREWLDSQFANWF
ncbi:DUF4190 domain-containing protein [Micromonospora auratinigra]|uniref:Thrombospondin type 3 repeat-containing protein n=1 Tax=Micromonospora auratinigra TaxID=261654 RepID=A0A1A8ZSQ9_9ACTN|nr:DUF4190 domain-containing protein [Micromonospora auratinigra]SBT46905.1 hypothetical protein GA0070611_3539 [Micromonospora auratinigra]